MPDKTIVLTGAGGVLGSAFASALKGENLVRLGRDALSPNATNDILRLVKGLNPSLLINCAADTDVEGAEAAPERAFAVNATLAGVLARAATETGATMLHFSSTGCYGAWKTTPYVEDDELRPTTVHHRSKAAGETLVRAANPAALILRLGWVFGGTEKQRKNFVWQRLLGARGKREVGADGTQIGCPTAASDVVMQSLALLRARESGVFNCVGAGGPASRLEYVAAILEAAGCKARVIPAVFPRRAPVSANEAAINARLGRAGLDIMPPWRGSLLRFVQSLPAASTAS
jgi:dTDP-4-dehydrorhamnose reductase